MSKPKTKRVRIALLIDENGRWGCAGWSGVDNDIKAEAAWEAARVDSGALHWIEVDVPVPQGETLEGEVTE